MTSLDRALLLLRELLQTPREELVHFPRRAGLQTQPAQEELEQAQELVVALVTALESDRGPAWQRIRDAWVGSRQHLGAPALGLVDPPPPAWLGNLPPMPSLGDPAPGTTAAEDARRQRGRFVPQATPAFASPSPPPAPNAPPVPGPPPTPRVPSAPREAMEPPRRSTSTTPVAPSSPMSLSATPPTPPISPLQALLAAAGGAPTQGWPSAGSPSTPPPPPVYGESYAVGPTPGAPTSSAVLSQSGGFPAAPAALSQSGGFPAAPAALSQSGGYAQGHPGGAPHSPSPSAPPAGTSKTSTLPIGARSPLALGFDLAAWSTSRYAALCAASSVDPGRVAEIQRDYGVPDAEARTLLDDHFADRFDRDPAEQEQWERLVVQFRERLRR